MLSKRRTTITGKHVSQHVPKIKPVKARRIIRRFHILIQKRKIICNRLQCDIVDNNEDTNIRSIAEFFKKNQQLRQSYEEGLHRSRPDPTTEKLMISIQNVEDLGSLCEVLGYICGEIQEDGGLQNYQLASTVGQDENRGGDSSKLLVEWCRELGIKKDSQLNALELGCLSARNHISKCGLFNPVVRIDLNSNDPIHITKQDFMERPLPKDDSERFDLISCSLVLNFVPTPLQRGEMILRFRHFLKRTAQTSYLFLVLPLPCINNSRYTNKDTLIKMMNCAGFTQVRYKEAKKVVYWLFACQASQLAEQSSDRSLYRFSRKLKIADKGGMNNFAITFP